MKVVDCGDSFLINQNQELESSKQLANNEKNRKKQYDFGIEYLLALI